MNKNSLFMKVDEVVEELGVSKPFAYKLMRQLNDELAAKGFVTIRTGMCPGRGNGR